jgi:hypothetical protein
MSQFITEQREGPARERANERPRVDGMEPHYELSDLTIRAAVQDTLDDRLAALDPVRKRLVR